LVAAVAAAVGLVVVVVTMDDIVVDTSLDGAGRMK